VTLRPAHAVLAAAMAAAAAACGATQAPRPRAAVAYKFECAPRDARVVVDEVDYGQCVLWEQRYIALPEGTHRLRVERDGYLPVERELPATGHRETVRIELREEPE
jgi:hypothetical protein